MDFIKYEFCILIFRYYLPDEAHLDGKLVSHIGGALFFSDHQDENEAGCIRRRVHIANSYKLFYKQINDLIHLDSTNNYPDPNSLLCVCSDVPVSQQMF